MALSSLFDIKATLYFRVSDSEMYGGPGSVGYALQAFDHCTDPENFDSEIAETCRRDMARMLLVSPDKLAFMTFEEYQDATKDGEDDEEFRDDEEDL